MFDQKAGSQTVRHSPAVRYQLGGSAMNSVVRLALLLAVPLTACTVSAPRQASIDIDRPPLRRFNEAEIRSTAESLVVQMGVEKAEAAQLTQLLDSFLADSRTKTKLRSLGCNAVGAFKFGSRGILITAGSGNGLLMFAGGSGLQGFSAKAQAIGVAREGSHGLLLVFGLKYEELFTDMYSFSSGEMSGDSASFLLGRGTPERSSHEVVYLGLHAPTMLKLGDAKGTLLLDRDPQ